MRHVLTALFLLASFHVTAESMMVKAYSEYRVGNADQAANLYEEILKRELEPLERSIVSYNLGSSFLQLEKWDEVLERDYKKEMVKI